MSLRVGIDTGGTFTDFVRLDRSGLTILKVRSTPAESAEAILAGLSELALGHAVARSEVVHGSTVATNAVLEGKGARVALVVTRGFEDVLAIGRQTRPALYNLLVRGRRTLVEPGLTFGIPERLDANGVRLLPIDPADVDRLAGEIAACGAAAVAVCFLHAYRTPVHERLVAERLRAAGLVVCASHEILPEYREYERWSTTVVNACVTPVMDRYLGHLERGLRGTGLSIMQSNGGSIPAGVARQQAVHTVLSGPAAGVIGARAVAEAAGYRRIITFDMGGTSTDVCLVDDRLPMTNETTIGDVPVRVPAIDIHTVGAGGGSTARLDSGGALRVGPESAGAVPGPACYGVGADLTVTDANLLLGRLDPDLFLGGRMALDIDRARRVATDVARRLGVDVASLAEGVVRVVNASMERAIRVVSLGRGHDPRRFTLVAFGGAGGMHACDLAAELSIDTVLVPRHAGVLSALGMLAADATRDYSASVLMPSVSVSSAELARRFGPLVSRATHDLSTEGVHRAGQVIERQIDVRYVGQSYELTIRWSPDYVRDFHKEHRRLYGHANASRPTEVVAVRVRAIGLTAKPALPRRRPRRRSTPVPAAVRAARFGGRTYRTACYRWDALVPGAHAPGPAVITGAEATIVVPPAFRFDVDGSTNVVLQRGRRR